MYFEPVLLQSSIGEIIGGLWPLILIVVVFYFFIIRPQQRKQKDQNNFLNSLEKGQQVVTASGLIGKINKLDDKIITLQVDTKTFVRVTKSAISKELTESVETQDGF